MKIRTRIMLVVVFLFTSVLADLPSLIQAKNESECSIKMSVSIGFEQSVKIGRMANVKITCTNQGKELKGYLQAMVTGSKSRDYCIYQSEITLDAGKKTNINKAIPTEEDLSEVTFRITDTKGNVIISQKKKITLEEDEKAFYVGLIGESQDYLKVVGGNTFKVIPIANADIPQCADGLDTLDAIYIGVNYIHYFRTEKLEAVKEWNKAGGNVFLGCKSEELLNFLEVDKSTCKPIKDNQGEILYNYYENENGIVLEWIASDDFITAIKKSQEYAKNVIDNMNTHFSNAHRRRFQERNTKKSCENNLIGSLEISDVKYLPNTVQYTLILIVYVLLIGPVFFLILRKIKKTIFYYVGIIIASGVFTFIFIIIGKNTRVESPIINSITFLNYEEGNKKVNEKNYFSVKLPVSSSELFSIEKKCNIELKNLVAEGNYTDIDWNYNKKCNILITKKEDSSSVEIEDSLYMKPYVFESKSIVELEGTIPYELYLDGENLSGTIKNQLGFDLENAILISDYRAVPIGELENGTSYTVGENQYIINKYEMMYNISSVVEKLSELKNTGNQNNLLQLRKFAAMTYCLQACCSSFENETYLIGFVKETDASLLDGITKEGIRCVVYHMDHVKKEYNGKKLLTDFSEYEAIASGSYNEVSRVMKTDTVVVYVLADSSYYYDSLIYNETLNETTHFKGKISLYNNLTNEYDEIFQDGNIQKIDREKYVASNNFLIVKYSCPQKTFGNQVNVLPIISATMEVK